MGVEEEEEEFTTQIADEDVGGLQELVVIRDDIVQHLREMHRYCLCCAGTFESRATFDAHYEQVSLLCLSVCLSVCLSFCPSIYRSCSLSRSPALSLTRAPRSISQYIYICLSCPYISVCLVCLSVCLSVCLCVCSENLQYV